jgi:NagD protein
MIGDRMDTDMIAGLEAGLRTVLVLTGSTRREQVERFPYRPSTIVDSIADVVELVDAWTDDEHQVVDFAR